MPASNYLVIQTPGDPNVHGASATGGGSIHAPGVLGSSAAPSQLNSPSSGSHPTPFGPAGHGGHGSLAGGKGATMVSRF